MEVLWAAHPLLRYPPGTMLGLPPGAMRRVGGSQLGADTAVEAMILPDRLDVGEWRKYYADPSERISWAELTRPDGGAVRLRWSTHSLPYLGVYAENRCYTDDPCIAVEPTTGWYDSLAFAAERGTVTHARPGVDTEWSVSISMRASHANQHPSHADNPGEHVDDR